MRRRRTAPVGALVGAILVVPALLGACGSGDSGAVDELVISDAWVRSTPPGADNGVGYLTIVSPTDDRLVGASVPPTVAEAAMVHESMLIDDEGGSAGGHHGGGSGEGTIAGGGTVATIELPAGEVVHFEPGGRHVMLVGLTGALRPGAVVPITLTLEDAGEITVEATVSANQP